MTHEDAGHYAAKHGKGARLDERIAAQLKAKAIDGRVSCSAAHRVAAELKVEPAEVGVNMDLLELRIEKCQLGLFGHSAEREAPPPPPEGMPEVLRAVQAALVGGRLPCAAAWEIGAAFGLSRRQVAAACDDQGIKVCACQIGAFK